MAKLVRTLILATTQSIGDEVLLKGWVENVRDHGKITFIDLKDRSGMLQCVGQNLPKISPQSAVQVVGTITKRPEKLVNKKLETGEIELQIEELEVLSMAQELPFDMGKEELDLELPTLLDWRALTLKHTKEQAIFKVQARVVDGFREVSKEIGCTEIFSPTISVSSTEGGTEVFKLKYYEHDAYLIQSPQLYKQISVGAFERVNVISHVYRAEPSATTRHLSELVQMDCELAFIDSFDELLDSMEKVGVSMIRGACEKSLEELRLYGIERPMISKNIPRLKLREAQDIIKTRTGRDLVREMDLNPEDEIEICKWALTEHKSDFVTITHFPTKKRAFYTYPDPADPEYSLSFDLLFRGIEICSGSQRINDYEKLVEAIKSKGMNPKDFEMYLTSFKYGMPPEGGFSFGLERITMKILDLPSVKMASLFPRDMERVDVRLSTLIPQK